jgi:hypothetical protein
MTSFDDIVTTRRGYLTRGDILDCGYTDRDIRAAVREGILERLRHGVYAYTAHVASLSPDERHLLVARSVLDKLGSDVALSHQSACGAHEIATWDVDLSSIHITRLDGAAGRREHGIVHHVGQAVRDEDIVEVDGLLVVRPARAAFEVSTLVSVESGIVTLDSVQNLGLASRDDLEEQASQLWNWQGARTARYALSLSDGRAQSPGESRSRYLFRLEGLPTPELQHPVHDEDGRLIGYTDFAWPEHRHLGEFDGLKKYGGIADDRRSPQEVVIAEKNREDRMRRRLWGMSRWVWADLDRRVRRETARRVAYELEQSRRLYARGATHIPLG